MPERETFTVAGIDCANLVITRPGRFDEILLIGAHYDTVRGSPGADDNASGVAGLLELSRAFTAVTPSVTVRFVAFTNEEPPFFFTRQQGSVVHARAARARGERIALMISLEMLGYYDGTISLISHDRDFLDRVVGAVVAPEGGGRWTEYAGGYSDMLAQRGEDLTREAMKQAPAKEVKAATEAQPRERKSVKRRLSFHEKHALETLPQTILALTEKVRALHGRLDDSGLYARDRKSFEETSAALASTQAELAAAEAKWLELEILREELEAGSWAP